MDNSNSNSNSNSDSNSDSNNKSEDVFPLVLDGSAVTEGYHEEEASADDCEDQSKDQEDKAEGEEDDDEDADEDLGVSDQQDVSSSVEDDDPVCPVCSGTPCEWEEFGEEVVESLERMYEHREDGSMFNANGELMSMANLCFECYTMFTRAKYGVLGKKNRIPAPGCVEQHFRDRCPAPDGNYTGFMAAEDDGNDVHQF